MFAALSQGSLIYLLDKSDGIKFKIGEVVSVSAPRANYQTPLVNQTVIDLRINIDGNECVYNNIPSNNTVITYNNGHITISETKLGLLSEVETMLQNSRLILNNIDTYKQNVEDCEAILKELNPQFAKDQERDGRLDSLENKLDAILKKLNHETN